MNPLESLFNRLHIQDQYGKFQAKGVERIQQLRALSSAEVLRITQDKKTCDKIIDALSQGHVSVPGALRAQETSKQGQAKQSTYAGRLTQGSRNNESSIPKVNRNLPSYSDAVIKEASSPRDDSWHIKGKKKTENTAHQSERRKKTDDKNATRDKGLPSNETNTPRLEVDTRENLSAVDESEPVEKRNSENTKPDRCKNNQKKLVITLSGWQLRVLFAENGTRLSEIHDANRTSNQRVFNKAVKRADTDPLTTYEPSGESCTADLAKTSSFTIYGSSDESCTATKEAIEKLVGISRQKEEYARFHYYSNEANMNIQAMQYVMHKNMQQDSKERLSDSTLQSIASFLNFDKQKGVEHYTHFCKNDKAKRGVLDLLIDQFAGQIQMIIFCTVKQAPLLYEHLTKRKQITNHVEPVLLVPATKEDRVEANPEELKKRRHDALNKFKTGMASSRVYESNGIQETVAQRMLIATDDYARYARTREIPYVNLIVHYSPPKQREWFLFRSETIARGSKTTNVQGLVGCELSLFSGSEEMLLDDLKETIEFKKVPHEEETEYFQRWSQTLKPEIKENPHVNYTKVEPLEN